MKPFARIYIFMMMSYLDLRGYLIPSVDYEIISICYDFIYMELSLIDGF
jgi:hypothetical protein